MGRLSTSDQQQDRQLYGRKLARPGHSRLRGDGVATAAHGDPCICREGGKIVSHCGG
jgi:hypothetical protein